MQTYQFQDILRNTSTNYNTFSTLRKHNSTHKRRITQHGNRIEYVPDNETTSELDKDEKQNSRILLEQFCTMLSLQTAPCSQHSTPSHKKIKPTERTPKAITKLPDYTVTYTNDTVKYKAIAMVLYVHSDAYCIIEPEPQSILGGHYFLSSVSADPSKKP